jgi:hypothetical protein
VITQKRGVLSVVTRVIALVCAIASAALAVYCVMLVYAATTFEHDSLPGPAVLSMPWGLQRYSAEACRMCFGG